MSELESAPSLPGFDDVAHRANEMCPATEKGEPAHNSAPYVSIRGTGDVRTALHELEYLSDVPLANPNPIFECNLLGEILFANKAAEPLVAALGPEGAGDSKLHEIWAALSESPDAAVPSFRVEVGGRDYELAVIRTGHGARFYANDITDLLAARRSLEAEERRYRLTFERAAVGIAHVGLDAAWLRVNQGLCDILGYEHDQLTRLTFVEITHPDDLDKDLRLLGRVAEGAIDTYTMEKRYLRGDGSYMWAQLTVSAMRDQDGVLEHYISVIEDISGRKAAEMRTQEEIRSRELLLDVVDQLVSQLDENAIYQTVADVALKCTSKTRVRIAAYDAERDMLTIKAAKGAPPFRIGMSYSREELPQHIWRCIDFAETVLVDLDAIELPEVHRNAAEISGARLVVNVPIAEADGVVGMIGIDSPGDATPFDPRQVAFVEQIAARAAKAIRHAQQYGRDHEVAEVLQEALLSLPRSVDGVEFGSVYRSATDRTRVGGDFIDVFPLRGDKVGFTLGDVSGKGLESAVVTAAVKNTIRAHALDGLTPAAVLSRVNDVLLHYTGPEMYVTAVFGILDTRTGRLVYANGGHPFPRAISVRGTCEVLDYAGAIVGAFSESRYIDRYDVLPLGNTLVMFSDGLVEARQGREMFGPERVRQALLEHCTEDPQDIAQALFDSALRFAQGHLADDVAVLAMRRVRRKAKSPQDTALFQ